MRVLNFSVYVSVLELVLGVDERLQRYCDPSSIVTSVDFDLRCTCKIVDVPFIGILSQMYPLECYSKDGPTAMCTVACPQPATSMKNLL